MTTQRLIRILVYEGDAAWIAKAIEKRGVKGSYATPEGIIREAIVGDFLETLIPPPEDVGYSND